MNPSGQLHNQGKKPQVPNEQKAEYVRELDWIPYEHKISAHVSNQPQSTHPPV